MIGKLTGSIRYQEEECLLTVFLKDFTSTNQHCYEAEKDRYLRQRYKLVPLTATHCFIIITISFIVKLNHLLRSLEIIFEKTRLIHCHPHHNIVLFENTYILKRGRDSWQKDNILTKSLYCIINFYFIQTNWVRFSLIQLMFRLLSLL